MLESGEFGLWNDDTAPIPQCFNIIDKPSPITRILFGAIPSVEVWREVVQKMTAAQASLDVELTTEPDLLPFRDVYEEQMNR